MLWLIKLFYNAILYFWKVISYWIFSILLSIIWISMSSMFMEMDLNVYSPTMKLVYLSYVIFPLVNEIFGWILRFYIVYFTYSLILLVYMTKSSISSSSDYLKLILLKSSQNITALFYTFLLIMYLFDIFNTSSF